jgi:sec-independent protein translocase protein TatA
MFGLGFPEILIILVILFLLFGAKKIPEIGSALGKTVNEIRKIRDERKSDKGKEKGAEKGNLVSDIKKEVNGLPGLKEAREIKETAAKIKNFTKILK